MRRVFLSFLLLLPLVSMNLWCQAVGGTLTGRVTATAGAAVPNAAVTITNTETNVSQRVLTGADGSFSVAGLPPGTYRVDVETAGYKRTSQQNIELTATAPASVNLTLEAGNMNETVEIKGTAPNVQGDNGELQLGIPTRTARELPVIDRNHQQLVELQTGVTPPVTQLPLVIDPARNRFFSTNGQSPQANTWFLEGVVNQEPFRGTAIRVQPVETVQNMNIVTGAYSAEKGYAGGAWTTTVTRGGTNAWHGSLFEFHSNNDLRSRPFFDMNGNTKPRFTYNQFGGTLGGAIVRDKTFFFGSYEGTYNRGENTNLTTVPTADMRAGIFSGLPGVTVYNPATGISTGAGRTAFPGNTIPGSRINPFSAAIQSYIPMPNLSGVTNNYIANIPYQNDWNKFDGRIDQHFSDRTSAFLRYGYSNLRTVDNSIYGTTIGSGDRDRLLAHNAVADVTHSFNPNLLTEFRFGYNRYYQKLRPGLDASPLGSLLNNSGFGSSLFNIQVSGLQPFGAPANLPMNGVDNTFNWVWNWSWHTDRHNVRIGTDIRRFRSDGFSNLAFGPLGGVQFGPGATLATTAGGLNPLSAYANSYASFLLGAPTATGSSQYTENPTYRQSNYALYLNDNVQIFRRLNLDLGVRWDVFSPLEPGRAGGAMFYDPAFNTLNFAGVNGTGMHVSRYDLNNVSPRIGFAFRATNKTVVRGGYGIEYFQVPYAWSGFMPTLTATSAGTPDTFATAPGGFPTTGSIAAPALNGQPLVNGMMAPNIPLNVIPVNTRTPYIQTFHFQVQQELMSNLVLNLGYVGTLGRQLPFVQELNAGVPGAGLPGLPFASFGRTASTLLYDNGVTNNYNALQVNLTKRFAHGLSFQGAYTWSKALGYTYGPNNLLINPANRAANYGPQDYDRQHVLTLSHVWELPIGAGTNHLNQGLVGQLVGNWQIDGIFTWATGTPLTVTANPLFCNCPNNTVLANVNGPVGANNNVGFGSPFFNTAAFSAPAANSLGTAGRGVVRGPGFKNYDMAIFRSFPFRDRYKLEFRGEVYNISNTPRFMNPVTNFNAADFGQVTGTLNGAFGRQFNLAARILF